MSRFISINHTLYNVDYIVSVTECGDDNVKYTMVFSVK